MGIGALLATPLLACGGAFEPEGPLTSGTRADASVPLSDAGAATLRLDASPRCQFEILGGVTASLRTAVVTGEISPGTTAFNLSLDCLAQGPAGALDAGGSYELRFDDVANVALPGSYSTDVTLIVGEYYFGNDFTLPSCTLVVDQFDPLRGGGMTASFSCPALLSQYEELSPPSQVSLSGSLVLPAIVPTAPPFDAGRSLPSNDAGAPNCTLEVEGDYETADLSGWGYAYSWNDLGYDAGAGSDVVACTTSVDGRTFSLVTGSSVGTQLTVSGETWCSAGCVASYEPTTPDCNLVVEENDGIGHASRASFECTLYLSSSDRLNGSMGSVRISGSFDGVESSPPPIK